MKPVFAITLDLDDTLWPIDPVIETAEQRLHEWLSSHCPRTTEAIAGRSLKERRESVSRAHSQLAHDLTRLREMSLAELIVDECGYDERQVQLAMEVFLTHRNRVRFFPDALPFLESVGTRLPIVGITNGNADLGRIGISGHFKGMVSAREAGVAKPHPDIFLAACQQLNCSPERVLHVGDHPTQDVFGALTAGMQSAWLNRTSSTWLESHKAHYEISSLKELEDLLFD